MGGRESERERERERDAASWNDVPLVGVTRGSNDGAQSPDGERERERERERADVFRMDTRRSFHEKCPSPVIEVGRFC